MNDSESTQGKAQTTEQIANAGTDRRDPLAPVPPPLPGAQAEQPGLAGQDAPGGDLGHGRPAAHATAGRP